MYYSKEDIERAKSTDVMDFISTYYGTSFKRQGTYYRCNADNMSSLVISRDKQHWFWNSQGYKGKGVIDWLMTVERMEFTKAVQEVLGNSYTPTVISDSNTSKISGKPIDFSKTPQKHYDSRYPQAAAYLEQTRGLSRHIINELMNRGKIYQDTRYNVVFANYDNQGKIAYWSLRGTHTDSTFKMNMPGSNNPYYGFEVDSKEPCENLYVFEAPIDLLSHCTIADIKYGKDSWKKDNRLALGGVNDAALESYLVRHPNIRNIKFCLDNDKAGISATEQLMKKYYDMGFHTQRIYYGNGKGKDLNEILCNYLKAEKRMQDTPVKKTPDKTTTVTKGDTIADK